MVGSRYDRYSRYARCGAGFVAGGETAASCQVIRHIGAEGLSRRPPVGACRLFLGPGFRLAARWNRLVETVKMQKAGKNGEKMGEIQPKKCEGRELTKDQLAALADARSG